MKKRDRFFPNQRLLLRIIVFVMSVAVFLSQINGEVLARFIWSG